jgi:alkylation response protein AidB-like acyl-CoA dehydrogenase
MTTVNPIPIEYSTAAKVYCTQTAYEVAHEAVQIHGANGLSPEYLVSKLFRDARGGLIGDGCNEVLGLKRIYNILENYKP